jgi:hypothetical protein
MRCFRKTTLSLCLFLASLLGASTVYARNSGSDASSANVSFSQTEPATERDAAERYASLPLTFEANQGQTDNRVRFISRGSGYSFFLTPSEAVLAFSRYAHTDSSVLTMQLTGANPSTQIQGLDLLPGKSNYFIGSDASRWRLGVPTYAKVAYQNVYPGIDLIYYGNQRQLEYDFVVRPGADPQQIRLSMTGAEKLTVDARGNLVLRTASGEVQLLAPKVYQEIQGKKHEIAGRWELEANNSARFQLGSYDHSQPLVIDPVLMYSSFLGGSQKNALNRIAIDATGNAYVAGYTASGDFPAAPTPQMMSFGGGTSGRGAFVAKIDPTGSTLLYSTYLSGSGGGEEATGLAIDNLGNVYLGGNTNSSDFPTYNAFQSTCATHNQAGTCSSAFLTKISPTGDSLLFSTYLGGSGGESARGLAVDASGNAYEAGVTSSLDFPVTAGSAQSKCGGSCQQNAFVAKFAASGSLTYAGYLGGSGVDDAADIAVDAAGSAYIAGKTTSADFPLITPIQKSCSADPTSSAGSCIATAFITKVKADGSAFVYSTYLGGSLGSQAAGIAVDSTGSAYVTGNTQSSDFPLSHPFQKSCGIDKTSGQCSVDAFVAKLAPSGNALVYSTYLGGSGSDQASGIAVDSAGNATIVGSTQSADFPTVSPLQSKLRGGSDAFVARLNSAGSSLTFSTYHGGSSTESGNGIALDTKGNIYIAGETSSPDFPTQHPFQSSCAGTCASAFVTKMSAPAAPPPTIVVTVNPSSAAVEVTNNQSFTATVTGSSNTGVTWGLSGSVCTGSACGTLNSMTANPVTYTAPASVPSGTITLTATADADGTTTGNASITITDFTLSLSSNTATAIQGLAATPSPTLTVTAVNGYTGVVTPGCSGQPTGVTCNGNPVTNSGTTTVTIATTSSTPTGASSGMTITGTDAAGNPVTHSQSFTLTVCSVAFSGNTPPANVNADASSGNNFTLTLTGGNCAWTASSDSSWLTISPASGSGSGTATWGVTQNTGTSSRTGHITIAGTTFTVTQAAVSVTVTPTSATVEVGQTKQFTATVTGATNKAVTWSLSCTTTPCGTLTPNNTANPVTYNAPTPTDPNTNPGPVTITATSQLDTTKSGTGAITVSDFSLSLSSNTATAIQGQPATPSPTLTVTAVNGYTGTVTPGCSGQPTGVNCTGNPVTNSGTTTITINTSSTTPIGASSAMKITGTDAASNPVTHNLAFTLTVCSISFTNPPPANVNADASSGTTTVTMTGGNCAWTTSSDASWLTITPGTSGSGTTTWAVTENTGTSARTGHITIGGTVFTVTQAVVSVSVTPTPATVEVGQTKQFTANVSGATNQAVTWSAPSCTNPPCGTITPTNTSNPITYNAPVPVLSNANVTNPSPVTLTATSQLDTGKSGSATITVSDFVLAVASNPDVGPTSSVTTTLNASAVGGYTGTISTLTCSGLPAGASCSFNPASLTVPGSTSSTLTITTSSTLPQIYTVTVQGTDGATNPVTHTTTFTLHVVQVTISTIPPATVEVNQTVPFAGATAGLTDTTVNWSTVGTACSGVACGTFSASGPNTSTNYLSPVSTSAGVSVAVKATSNGDPNFSAQAPPISPFIYITDYTVSLPATAFIITQNIAGTMGALSTLTATGINNYVGVIATTPCSVTPSGASAPTCSVAPPSSPQPASSSPVSISTAANTPVGLYSMAVAATDSASNPQTRMTNAQQFAVECNYSLGNSTISGTVPTYTPSNTAAPYSLFVTETQGGGDCPWGPSSNAPLPGPVEGTTNITIVTGSTGVVTAPNTGSAVIFNVNPIEAGALTPQTDTITVNYFQVGATDAQNVGSSTLEVVSELPVTGAVTPVTAGVEQGTVNLTVTQTGTLTIPTITGTSSVCNVVGPTGPTITCAATLNQGTWQITVSVSGAAQSSRNEHRGLWMSYAVGLPAIVFLGAGFSAFAPRSKRRALKRIASLLTILLVISLLAILPSCSGGFHAAFFGQSTTTTIYTLNVMGYVTDANSNVTGVEIFTIPLSNVQ